TREGKRRIILGPAAADLAVSQPPVNCNSKACSDSADPFLPVGKLNRPQRRGHSKTWTAKAGPIKLALDTNKKVAGLQVVTELKAPDKRGAEGIIPRRARDAQRAVGPGTPDVGTQIKPGPIVRRRCHGARINWRMVGGHGGICHADVKKDTNHKRK